MKKGIEVWSDYDKTNTWTLHIKKAKGKLTLDEIEEACKKYGEDFYLLVIKAIDTENEQFYMVDDLSGDFVTLYRADDFFNWRNK